LNHLSLDGEGRIVFDAGDTVLGEDEDEKAEISQDGDIDLDLESLQGVYSQSGADLSSILPGSQ
jgi:hypothetical protein